MTTDRSGMVSVPNCPMCGGPGWMEVVDAIDACGHNSGGFSYRRCKKCYSLWLDPRPTPERVADLYPTSYYTHNNCNNIDGFSKPLGFRKQLAQSIIEDRFGYPALSSQRPSGSIKILAKLLGMWPSYRRRAGYHVRYLKCVRGGRLLDVGVGNGEFLKFMTELGWIGSGIEPDGKAAEVARNQGISVETVGVEDFIPDPTGYDAICMTHVIEHLIDPAAALGKLYRSLKPGGVLVSLSPNPRSAYLDWFNGFWRDLDPPRHLVFPSPQAIRRSLVSLGARTIIVRTQTRAGHAEAQQSMNLRDLGPSGLYNPRSRWTVSVENIGCRLREFLSPDAGNELLCIATKPNEKTRRADANG